MNPHQEIYDEGFSDGCETMRAEIERLRAYISDLDGKHIGTPTDGGESFIDEGVIVASDVLGTQAG